MFLRTHLWCLEIWQYLVFLADFELKNLKVYFGKKYTVLKKTNKIHISHEKIRNI